MSIELDCSIQLAFVISIIMMNSGLCATTNCAHLMACCASCMRKITNLFPCHLQGWFEHVDPKKTIINVGLQEEGSEVGHVSGDE